MEESKKINQSKFRFWYSCLIISIIITISFGLILFLIGLSYETSKFFVGIFANTSEFDKMKQGTQNFIQLFICVLGAIIICTGILSLMITLHPLKNQEKWALQAIFLSFLIWYGLDTIASIYFSIWFNVILNTVILIIIEIPIMGLYFSNY